MSDDEGSVVGELTKTNNCGACRTRESETWWKAPKGLATNVLCDNCGISWRKYADLNIRPLREDPSVAKPKSSAEKREGTPLAQTTAKRPRVREHFLEFFVVPVAKFLCQTSVSQTSPPPTAASQIRCSACHKNGPIGKILRCRQCQFRVHPGMASVLIYKPLCSHLAGAYGASIDPASNDSWTCDLCLNEKNLEASLVRISIFDRLRHYNYNPLTLCVIIETGLSPLPSITPGSEEETALPATRHIPPGVQAHRGPGMVSCYLRGVRARGRLHGCEPVTRD